MKIFITGNLGFIGSYLSEELIMENHSLIGYDIQEHKGNVGYPSAQGDVRDVLRLQQSIPHDTELIIHLAAEHKDFGVSEDEYFDVNERGTQYLLECATKYNINKFIFYSSVAIYGNQKFTTEETVPEPGNPYGASKLAAENLISMIKNSKKEEFVYQSKGQLAIIGKRTGIATILGMNISGFLAWLIWRNVYLLKVPTFDKKTRVFLDWMIDLFFDRDVSRLNYIKRETEKEYKLLDEVDDLW